MLSTLFATLLGLPRWVKIAGAIAVAVPILLLLAKCAVSDIKDSGATEQREADLRETVKRVETANDARDEIRNDSGTARYDQCLRTARTPANCERFLPERQAPNR